MVVTITEDTPADMLAGSMELLVQLPHDHHHTHRVTVQRSTPMMDLLVQIATAQKLSASSYTLQAIDERGFILPHHSNTPIGSLDALQVKLLPKQETALPRKKKPTSQPFETTFRLQVHLPRNQLYVSRVSPKMILGDILDEVCREKNLDRNKYELRHPVNLEETLDLALSLQDYNLQEVSLYPKEPNRTVFCPTMSSQDIMTLKRQEDRRRQWVKQNVFGSLFRKSKSHSMSSESLGGRSVSPTKSDPVENPLSLPPQRPHRKKRPAPKPPITTSTDNISTSTRDSDKEGITIIHSRNSSDSSGYHEASVLSDNNESAIARQAETLPRRLNSNNNNRLSQSGVHDILHSRNLVKMSQTSKSLSNLAMSSGTLSSHGSLSNFTTASRKKRAAPSPPPGPPSLQRSMSSATHTEVTKRIKDTEMHTRSLESNSDRRKPSVKPRQIFNQEITKFDYSREQTYHSDIDEVNNIEPQNKMDDERIAEIETVRDSKSPETAKLSRKRDQEDDLPNINDSLDKMRTEQSTPTPVCTPLSTTLIQEEQTFHPSTVVGSNSETEEDVQKCTDKPKECELDLNQLEKISNPKENGIDSLNVSLTEDTDLSISEWKYNLPEPPSPFQDSFVTDEQDVIHSEAEPRGTVEAKDEVDKVPLKSTLEEEKEIKAQQNTETRTQQEISKSKTIQDCDKTFESKQSTQDKNIFETNITKSSVQEKINANKSLSRMDSQIKMDIITELEFKIDSGTLPRFRGSDSIKLEEDSSPSNVAPVDNHLPNFTIATYSTSKNNTLNERNDSQKHQISNDDRKSVTEVFEGQFKPKRQIQLDQESEKTGIRRSNSCAIHSDTKAEQLSNHRDAIQEYGRDSYAKTNVIKKATSVINLNVNSMRQTNKMNSEEKTPLDEKNSQSLKISEDNLRAKHIHRTEKEESTKTANETSVEELRVKSAPAEQTKETTNLVQMRKSEFNREMDSKEPNRKRFTYSGPPTITLGVWSERPNWNVQIKGDTDYIFGDHKSTVNNHSERKIEKAPSTESEKIYDKPNSVKLENNTPVVIRRSHSTVSDDKFQSKISPITLTKPPSTRVENIKPIDVDVKNHTQTVSKEMNNDNKIEKNNIDTASYKFSELTRVFSQNGSSKPRPKSLIKINTIHNRPEQESTTHVNNIQPNHVLKKQNVQNNSSITDTNDVIIKQQSSNNVSSQRHIILQNQTATRNSRFQNEHAESNNSNILFKNMTPKINSTAPIVVKGFRVKSTNAAINENSNSKQHPTVPTVPVITGVTLKNTTTTTKPQIQSNYINPRELLLESIRNFGDSHKLRSVQKGY